MIHINLTILKKEGPKSMNIQIKHPTQMILTNHNPSLIILAFYDLILLKNIIAKNTIAAEKNIL